RKLVNKLKIFHPFYPLFVFLPKGEREGWMKDFLKEKALNSRAFLLHHSTSRLNVTGPSLTRCTFISAAKIPVCTCSNWLCAYSTSCSHSALASAGGMAGPKSGRNPFWVCAIRVNCETSNKPPPAWATFQPILPCSSSKKRYFNILSISFLPFSRLSSLPKPRKTRIP